MLDGMQHEPVRAPSRPRLVHAAAAAVAIARLASGAAAQGLYSDEALARGVDFYVAQGMFSGGGQFGCGVALVDLDNDGDDDIVCLGAQDDRLGFFRNDGTGQFANVSAKTGTLRWANALSGYLTTAGGERLAFALLLNRHAPEAGAPSAREELDQVVALLAGYAGPG